MKPKVASLCIGVVMAVVFTMLWMLLPSSANLNAAYVFCLISIVMMVAGVLCASLRNIPASYALILQTGRFLPMTLILSALVLALQETGVYMLPVAWHVLLQVALFAVYVIGVIKIFAGKSYIDQIDRRVASQTGQISLWLNQVNALYNREEDAAARQALKRVAEAIRYSDPMSTNVSAELDRQISKLTSGLLSVPTGEVETACQELLLLVKERNDIVKAGK